MENLKRENRMKVKITVLLLFLCMLPLFSSQKLKFVTVQNSVMSDVTQQVLKEAYSRLGIEIIIEYYPAKRSLILANEGKEYDGELHRIIGMEKRFPNLVRVPVFIYLLEGMVVSKKINFEVKGWESLKPYTIAVRRGIAFTVNGTAKMDRVILNSNEHLFQMLDNDRIDIIVLSRINALKYLKTQKASKSGILEPPVQVYEMYHYLHKKNNYLVPKLTRVLKDMQTEGLIQKIRNDYLKGLLIR